MVLDVPQLQTLLRKSFNLGTEIDRRAPRALVRLQLAKALVGLAEANATAAKGIAIEREVSTEATAGSEADALHAAALGGMPDPVFHLCERTIGIITGLAALWNTLYIDKAVAERRTGGRPAAEELLAGLSPLICDHLNFNGRYFFPRSELDGLRALRDPDAEDDDSLTERRRRRPLAAERQILFRSSPNPASRTRSRATRRPSRRRHAR